MSQLSSLHSCPDCDEACYCDIEDHDTGEAPDDCSHVCEEVNEEYQ